MYHTEGELALSIRAKSGSEHNNLACCNKRFNDFSRIVQGEILQEISAVTRYLPGRQAALKSLFETPTLLPNSAPDRPSQFAASLAFV